MKKNEARISNTKIAVLFFAILLFFIGLSLVFKTIIVIRAGQFDDSKRFNLAISDNKTLKIMSISGSSKSITVFNLDKNMTSKEAGRLLEIPIDGFMISSALDLDQKPDSLFFKSILNAKTLQTNLTIIDLLKLTMTSKAVGAGSVRIQDIASSLTPSESDKIVGQLVSDELIEKDNQTIQITNGTTIGGLGNRLARLLTNMGGDVIIVATSDSPRKRSTISYIDQKTYTVEKLEKVLGYPAEKAADNAIADITVTIGEDKTASLPF